MNRSRQSHPATPRGQRLFCVLALSLLVSGPMVAAAESPPSFPAKGLNTYLEYDGLEAHDVAWKATAAYAMFEQTPVGGLTADIARQVIERLLKSWPDPKQGGADLLALREDLVRSGLSLGVYNETERGESYVVVLKSLGRPDARERVGRLARAVARSMSRTDDQVGESIRFRGRELFVLKDLASVLPEALIPVAPATKNAKSTPMATGLAWWFEGDDLIIVGGSTGPNAVEARKRASVAWPLQVRSVIDTIEGEASSVLTHPSRAAALVEGRDINGFEATGLFFVDAAQIRTLHKRLSDRLGAPAQAAHLPQANPIQEHVPFFAPGPDFPVATSQAAAQKQANDNNSAEQAPSTIEPPPKIPVPPVTPAVPAAPTPESSTKTARSTPAAQPQKNNNIDIYKSTGLDGVARIVGRWGFQGKALMTDVRVEAPAPRRGLVGLVDQPGFRKDGLPPIPRGAGSFVVGSGDLVKLYDAWVTSTIGSIGLSGGEEETAAVAHGIELLVFEATGQRLHEDLLGHVGPTWGLYSDPHRKKGETRSAVPTLLVEIDDAKAFGKVLDSLAKRLNSQLRATPQGDDKNPSKDLPTFALEPLPAPERGYHLTSPAGIISWLEEANQPTLLLGESYVALAANPAMARAALAVALQPAERWVPSGELVKAFECLPGMMTSLSVGDPRDSAWPEMLVSLPKLVQHVASAHEVFKGKSPATAPGSSVLSLLGVPRAGGFHLRIDPAKTPKSEGLRAQLFPSVTATAVDDLGIRLISREAIPFACAEVGFRFSESTKSGESLTVHLTPFLFPCVQLEFKHDSKSNAGKFNVKVRWTFAQSDEIGE